MRRVVVIIIAVVGASLFLGLGIKSVYGQTSRTRSTILRTSSSLTWSSILPPPPDPTFNTKYRP